MGGAAEFQYLIATYESEAQKTASVWRCFTDEELEYRPHPKSQSVIEEFRHELLSQRRFFAEFLGSPEPGAGTVLPAEQTVAAYVARMLELARPRMDFLARQPSEWWVAEDAFFDVVRQHAWILVRRILHSAHHRTQLTVYLRLLDKQVPSVYGPTADVTWAGADPTLAVPPRSR